MEEILKEFMNEMREFRSEVNERLTSIEKEVKEIKEDSRNVTIEFRSHFKHLESQLEQQQQVLIVTGEEIKKVKIDNQYLSGKIGQHDLEINNLNRRIQT